MQANSSPSEPDSGYVVPYPIFIQGAALYHGVHTYVPFSLPQHDRRSPVQRLADAALLRACFARSLPYRLRMA